MEKRLVSPGKFKTVFQTVEKQYSSEIVDKWTAVPEFTALALGNTIRKGLCAEIADTLHLWYSREYWSLDAIYYTAKQEKYFSQKATYAEYIAIALEHENNYKTSYEEINKLAIFSSPLKVLITYPQGDFGKLLDEYADIISKADIFSNFDNLQRHLVIFGFLNKDKNQVDWKFFLYGSHRFNPI